MKKKKRKKNKKKRRRLKNPLEILPYKNKK
jgi:hypothetical protein